MGPDFLLGLLIFFGFLFISRVFNLKALNTLTNEEKGKMISNLQGIQKYYLIPLVLIIFLMFMMTKFTDIQSNKLFVFYFFILAIYLVVINIYVFKKLNQLNFKKEFTKNFVISKILNYIGMSIFFIYLLMGIE